MSNYQLNGTDAGTLETEVRRWNELELTFRVTRQTLVNVFKPLEGDAGSVDRQVTDDGGYRAKDRANGAATVTVNPYADRQPLRETQDAVVVEYEDELASQDGNEYTVSLVVAPKTSRDTTSMGLSQTGTWEFSIDEGTIATERVDATLNSRGDGGMDRWELTTRLTAEQAEAFERSLSRLHGVRIREIPDGSNFGVDDTNGRGTLTLTSPDDDNPPSGEYVVSEWQSTWLNDDFQELSFDIIPTG